MVAYEYWDFIILTTKSINMKKIVKYINYLEKHPLLWCLIVILYYILHTLAIYIYKINI